MLKRISLIVGSIFLSLLLLGYLFRLPILQWVIAPELNKAGVTLSCLDFSITAKLNIHADKICLSYKNQQLTLSNITANKKNIEVENATLTINPLPKSQKADSTASKFNLALPKNRPLITINQLLIESDNINNPLKITVNEPNLNTFILSGDLNANVKLSNDQVSGQFSANDELINKLIDTQLTRVANLTFNTEQTFSFDGVALDVKSNVDALFNGVYRQCNYGARMNGDILGTYNVNSKALTLDAHQLNNTLSLAPTCSDLLPENKYADFAAKQIPLNWQLNLPKKIKLSGTLVTVSKVELVSTNNSFLFALENTQLNTQAPLSSVQSNLDVKIVTADINHINVNTTITGGSLTGNFDIGLDRLPKLTELTASKINLHGEFGLNNLGAQPAGHINSNLKFSRLSAGGIKVDQYQGDVMAKIDEQLNAEVVLSSQIDSALYKQYKLSNINNTTVAKANVGVGELFAHLTASTKIKAFNSANLTLNDIKVESKGLQSRALQASHHAFINGVEMVVNHHISPQAHPFEVIFPEQSSLSLNVLLGQFYPLAKITEGSFTGSISGDVNLQQAKFRMHINKISALYNDYLVNNLSSGFTGQYDSGQLNVTPTTFDLDEFRAGVVVKEVTGNWRVDNNVTEIADVAGSVLDGRFTLDNYTLNKQHQVTTVKFNSIDAGKLISLDDKSGITLTGRLAGNLPIVVDKSGLQIKHGSLFSQGEGSLKIHDNAAFNSVMEEQQELQPILELLTDLDIQKLTSSVVLKEDGWSNLGVNLQGHNQQEKQQVNFNYNHEENIFTLLRALRLSDEITQKVEQQFSQKGNEL